MWARAVVSACGRPSDLTVLTLAAGLLAGCGGLADPSARQQTAQQIAAPARMAPVTIPGPLPLQAYLRQQDPAQPLTVYIEGDGLAWLSRTRPSSDPTPRNPLGLRLAALDPSANVGWLARPCMYGGRAACADDSLWTEARFSETAVQATMRGLDALARPGQKIHLVGYSGGGAIAALVAARRSDVASLRTVAGNLDTATQTAIHKVDPLTGSLNPADSAAYLVNIPQVHFSGDRDKVVPFTVPTMFMMKRRQEWVCSRLVMVPEADHENGWVEAWPRLVRQSCP